MKRTTGILFLFATCLLVAQTQTVDTSQIGFSAKDNASSTATDRTPTFHAQASQVIVQAQVWGKARNKHNDDWSPAIGGLAAQDFHVFDNGVEQSVNYFNEADFPGYQIADQWSFVAEPEGTWGIFNYGSHFGLPLVLYFIGYIPPALQPGECHSVRIVVADREVETNRRQYCAPTASDSVENSVEKKPGSELRALPNSPAHEKLKIAAQAFVFWSSGVLQLSGERRKTGTSAELTEADYTHSYAPLTATVHVALDFGNLLERWNYPCEKGDLPIRVIGSVFKADGEYVAEFAGDYHCEESPSIYKWQRISKENTSVYQPNRFYTELQLPPGNYELRVVASDEHNFGRVQIPVQVKPLDAERLGISDVVKAGTVREAAWLLRDAASVAPARITPTPLVSKNLQFFPDCSPLAAHVAKESALFLYFEIYEPPLRAKGITVYYRVKITNPKTGSLIMDTGATNAAEWRISGNEVIPIGLKLVTKKLKSGPYKIEVQASDSKGNETEWQEVK